MAYSDRDKACLVHGIFYGIQIGLVFLSGIFIFNGLDPRLSMYLNLEDDTNIYGDNPGLSFRPMTDEASGTSKSIISYKLTDRDSYLSRVTSLERFLKGAKSQTISEELLSTNPADDYRVYISVYRAPGLMPGRGSNIRNCDYHNPPAPGQVCDVEVKHFSACIAENYFSYHKGSPCVFLRLNTPPGWRPVFYNNTDSLPDAMPASLKSYISNLKNSNPRQLNTVWVSCEGENPADLEFIGPIEYIPFQGFPGYYFLNDQVEGYLSPLVAVHFTRPMTGPLINIKCKAWARNIKHDDYSALGGVRFGLMIDN